MGDLDDWTAQVSAELGLPPGLDRALVLDLARDVAHGVARPAAPLTTFLVGLAAGRAGGSPDDVRRATDAVLAMVAARPPAEQTAPPATEQKENGSKS